MSVFGLEDVYTKEALTAWTPLSPQTFSIHGLPAFGYAPGMQAALRREQIDIAHTHGIWMYPSAATLLWARHTQNPYVVTPHGMLDPWAVQHAGWKKRIVGMLFQHAHLREAACLHALNRREAKAFRAYGLENPICIIPNGIDLPQHEPAPVPPWQEQLAEGRKVLLFLGRIHPKKGLAPLLEAWQAGVPDEWALALVGWGEETDVQALEEQLAKERIPHVHFLGPLFGKDKAAAYQHADAFILPSFSEGLPMTILEAWAYGLPVLMTEFCNLPEGFEAEAALEVAPQSSSILEGLKHVFSLSSAEREAMGIRGKALVAERFTWAHVAQELQQVYHWVLHKTDVPACVVLD